VLFKEYSNKHFEIMYSRQMFFR